MTPRTKTQTNSKKGSRSMSKNLLKTSKGTKTDLTAKPVGTVTADANNMTCGECANWSYGRCKLLNRPGYKPTDSACNRFSITPTMSNILSPTCGDCIFWNNGWCDACRTNGHALSSSICDSFRTNRSADVSL